MAKASLTRIGKNSNIYKQNINNQIPKIKNGIKDSNHTTNKKDNSNKSNFLVDLIKNDNEFKVYIFKEVDFLNTYFNSIFLPIIKDKNRTIKNIAENYSKNKKEISKEDKKILNDIIQCSNSFDFYSKIFCDVFSEYYKNNSFYFNEKLNYEFLIFPDLFKTNFNQILNVLKDFRHFIQHNERNCPNSNDIINALLILLPYQRITELYNQIFKVYIKIKDTIDIKDNLIKEFIKSDEVYLKKYKKYKEDYKKKISELHSMYLSKKYIAEQTKDLNNSEKTKKFKQKFRERKRVLLGEYKYKKDNKLENGFTNWRKLYNLTEQNYEKFFGNTDHFYGITTFKKIYNYISFDVIKKIQELFKETLKEHKIENYKIQFSYIEDFYFANLKINFLINKYLEIIKDKLPNSVDNDGKFEDKSLRDIRNCFAHNNLFYFAKTNGGENINQKNIINIISEKLKEINISYQNDFLMSFKSILFNLKTPNVYNTDGNKIKSSNTKKLKKYLKYKDNPFKVDDKRMLVLIVNELIDDKEKIFYRKKQKNI